MPTTEHFNPVLVTQEMRYQLKRKLKAFGLCNTDYQGVISKQGGTVRVVKPSGLTVKPYAGSVVYEEADSSQITMSIDQADYIAATIEDMDQALTSFELVEKYLSGGIDGLAGKYDKYLFEEMGNGAHADNVIDSVVYTTNTIVEAIDEAETRLKEADIDVSVPKFFTVSPREASLVRLSDHFTKASELSDKVLVNGVIGKVFNMNIVESNNLKTEVASEITTGDPVNRYLPYGVIGALSTASAIPHKATETMRAENAFADRFRALHFYGSKVFEPKMLGVAKSRIGTGTA